MKPEDLYHAIGQADETLLERSERNKYRRKKPWCVSAVAAVLVLAVLGGVLLRPDSTPLVTSACAISESLYPEMVPYPDETSADFQQQYDAWYACVQKQQQPEGYADGLDSFFSDSIRQFLTGAEGKNRVYSPLNVYMALAMLAEITDGNSRQQILELLGVNSIEALRTQASAVWNGHYRNDGATTSIIASSLWLNENISFAPETIQQLCDTYYASVFQGEMGSDELNQTLQNWLNAQTGGLLEDQIQNITLDANTVMALATTIYYQAKWASTFSENSTTPDSFHALSGDMTCDFMHDSSMGNYYWGDKFGAVSRRLENDGGTMWFLLPNEGVTVQELLQDQQVTNFLLAGEKWENNKYLNIHLTLPKFDISSQMELSEGLQKLGVTDVFDPSQSDFTPMTEDLSGVFISQAKHGVRVAVDEEGVTAAAYTVMAMAGAGAVPEDENRFYFRPSVPICHHQQRWPAPLCG